MDPTLQTTAVPMKMIIAVHGIGDQIGYATAQSVVSQVGNYYDIMASMPLGRFYATLGSGECRPAPIVMSAPPDPAVFVGLGFAEVYWAEVPRRIVREGHILEETKK
jgi:hypothetical protein